MKMSDLGRATHQHKNKDNKNTNPPKILVVSRREERNNSAEDESRDQPPDMGRIVSNPGDSSERQVKDNKYHQTAERT